jgi:peptide/nickel transport system substrate-binding protein
MKLRRRTLVAGCALATAIVAGVLGGTTAASPGATGGTVVFGAEQEPPCLNGVLAGCNNTWTSWTVGMSFPGLYKILPNGDLAPDLLDGEAKFTKSPFTVTYKIKKNANWSDGKPVTAQDVIFTLQTIVNPKNDVASRSGYTDVARAKAIDSKTVKLTFRKPYAAWKFLFYGQFGVLPKHALQGKDFNEIWNTNVNSQTTGKPIGSGPFILESYTKGQSLTMVRNPKYYGKQPKIGKIVFRFITNTDSEIQAIKGGEVDAIYPQPQLQLGDLRRTSGLKVLSSAGSQYEHIDFNAGKKGFPLARAPWFRQAFAYSIDRAALTKQLFGGLKPDLKPLESLTYQNTQKQYQPHFSQYTYNPTKAGQIMAKHGCTKGGDGIFVCNGIRASVKYGTTAGNRLRELSQEIVQAQAKKSGIEVTIANAPSRIFFPQVANEDYQLALFAWVGTGDPSGITDIYKCGGESNWMGYCSKKVTDLLVAADQELDPATRVKLVNAAGKIMGLNVPSLPLYQKPTFLVYKSKLQGLADNPTTGGPLWNIENWTIGS